MRTSSSEGRPETDKQGIRPKTMVPIGDWDWDWAWWMDVTTEADRNQRGLGYLDDDEERKVRSRKSLCKTGPHLRWCRKLEII